MEGLEDAIKKKSTNSIPDDAAGAVPQVYVQDVRVDANLNVPSEKQSVKSDNHPNSDTGTQMLTQ